MFWRKFFHRSRLERDLDAEIRSHLQEEARQRIERGEKPEEAWASAVKDFGNIGLVKEAARQNWTLHFLDSLIEDLRFATRICVRYPGFSAAVVLILALCVGVNVAIFSVMNAVMLRSMPYEDPERVVTFDLQNRITGENSAGISPGLLLDLQQLPVFESVAMSVFDGKNWTGAGEPEELQGLEVSSSFFEVLKVKAAAGRLLTLEDSAREASRAVVFSHALWARRLGQKRDAIGRTVVLDGVAYTLAGILPKDFIFPDGFRGDYYVPLTLSPEEFSFHNSGGHLPFARLRPGVTQEQAQVLVDDLAKRLEAQYPETNAGLSLHIVSIKSRILSEAPPFAFVQSAALLVLLIGCANLGSLFVSRSISRNHEVAIRAALGAGRRRLLRQLLMDAGVLGMLGGVLGLLLAFWTVGVFSYLMPSVPRIDQIPFDGAVLAFTAVITAGSTLLFSVFPALKSSGSGLPHALNESRRAPVARWGWRRSQGILVGVEVALSLMLLILAGLAVNSSIRLNNVDPGFDPGTILTVQLRPAGYGSRDPGEVSAFYEEAVRKIEGMPGVEAVAAATYIPMSGVSGGRTAVTQGETKVSSWVRLITADYFRALRIPIRQGRSFNVSDHREGQRVAIVNETLAAQLAVSAPVGSTIGVNNNKFTIVGIAKDVLDNPHSRARPEVYLSLLQAPRSYPSVYLLSRVRGKPEAFAGAVRSHIWEIDSDQPISEVASYSTLIRRLNVYTYFLTSLQTSFAVIAIVLAALGIYSVLSYATRQRTREIGLRMALGAEPSSIVALVLKQAGLPVFGGVVLGLASAIALAVYAKSRLPFVLFQIRETDLLTYFGVTLLLMVVAGLAAFLPARRASRLDPASVLRHD